MSGGKRRNRDAKKTIKETRKPNAARSMRTKSNLVNCNRMRKENRKNGKIFK